MQQPGMRGGEAARSGHCGSVDDKPASWESRREEIGRRLAAIRARMDELKRVRQDDASAAAVRERIGSAQRQAAASEAAAKHAIAASIRAFRRSAQAHEHAALQHERAAAAGFGDKDQHEQQAARHRAAAAADTQRAEHAQSLLGDEEAEDVRRSDVDQALDRLIQPCCWTQCRPRRVPPGSPRLRACRPAP
jgi:chromosome segregation ATPase